MIKLTFYRKGDNMDILSIGHAVYDITILMDDFPVENTKYRVDNRIECGGGPANNTAYLLGKWGMNSYFAGVVGNDLYGKKIKEELDSVSVNTKYLQLNNAHSTTTSFILVNKKTGSRTTFAHKPNSMKMVDVMFDIDPSIIIVDGQEPEISKKAFRKYPNAIKIIDAGRDHESIKELCHLVDYVICSKSFAESITGININYTYTNSIVEAFTMLKNMYKNNIIITLEDKGCVYSFDDKIKLMPSIRVNPVDTTGAGDVFHGAFAYGLANNFDLEKSLKYANIAGALSTEKIGVRNSIPNLNEVEEKYEQHK